MELVIKSKNKKAKQKKIIDHYWYDVHTQQMLHGRGGKMVFKYVPEYGRSIPYVVDDEETVYKNDFSEIEEWVKKNKKRYDLEVNKVVSERRIVIEIDKDDLDKILRDLRKHNFSVSY